jgi:DNA-binding response OmpR family regulator
VLIVTAENPIDRLNYVRSEGVVTPVAIIFTGLTRPNEDEALHVGASIVTRWPLSVARLYGVLRRLEPAPRDQSPGALPVLDSRRLTVRWNDREVRLTPHEFSILQGLLQDVGRPVASEHLRTYAWGSAPPKRSANQVVTVYVCRLRDKLRQIGLEGVLQTVREFGYAYVPQP